MGGGAALGAGTGALIGQAAKGKPAEGALIGGASLAGTPEPWRGRVEADGAGPTNGDGPVPACAAGNADRHGTVDGPSVVDAPAPATGSVPAGMASLRKRLLNDCFSGVAAWLLIDVPYRLCLSPGP